MSGGSGGPGPSPGSGLTPERWGEIERVLDAALDAPPEARAEVLDRACAGDPELRRQVESLLRRRPRIDGFLEGSRAEAVGRRIGAYRLVRLIGRGGMGEVYLAERADGHFDQRVALKLLPAGLEADGVARRLRAERQILAGLEHPSIARLLDGGVTGDGRPYLVMEHVEGEPVDRHCDGRGLTVRERLRVFLRVAEAVQHAHRSLVVHRDLKPSNIHVTGDGRVKLLDFGIAKLLDEEKGAAPPVTRTGRRWMTPEFAAPEQIEGEPVTTATDVYQLGVLLYVLVAGRPPFPDRGESPHRLERTILRTDPPRPSEAVREEGEMGDGGGATGPEAIARARSSRPDRLARRLRGDLDAIVLRALRKEPEERYPSVRAMAGDVERHLRGEPVRARRGSFAYRARKFLRRHRWGAAAAAGFVVLLAGYAATVTVHSNRVRAALDEARVEARTSEQVTDYLVDLFETNDPGEARGAEVTARELLDRGVERASGLEGEPEVQARLLAVTGRIYRDLGEYDEARPLLERALKLRRSLHGEAHGDVATSLNDLATLAQHEGRYDAAEARFREALEIRRRLHGGPHEEVMASLNNLALLLQLKSDLEGAEPLFRRAVAMHRELGLGEGRGLAAKLNNLAMLLRERGELEAAEARSREALALYRSSLGSPHPEVAMVLDNLASILRDRGEPEAAEPLVREALGMYREVLGEDHPDVTTTLHHLATLLRERGSYAEAEALAREVLARDRRQLGDDHPYVATSLAGLARVHMDRGAPARAEPLLREAVAIQEAALAEDSWRTAATRGLLGECLAARGRTGEARPLLRRSHARLLEVFGADDHRTREAARRLTALGEGPASDAPAAPAGDASPEGPGAAAGDAAPDGPGAAAGDGAPPGRGAEVRAGRAGVSWTGSVVVDSGGGHVGPWRMNRSDWRYVDDPTVALDDAGRAAVAWVDQARRAVLFQRYGPGGEPLLEAPVDVSGSPDVFSWLPRVAVPPDDPDRVYLLWQEIVFSGGTHGGEAFFARSTDGGRTFDEPVNLSRTEAGVGKGRTGPRRWHNGSLDLALGPDGGIHAAWTAFEGGLWVGRSTDGGASFGEPVRVTEGGAGEPARAPTLAAGPDGRVHLAWAVGGEPAADLRYAVSEDGGRTFDGPRALFAGGGHADAPTLAADAAGTLHLAWSESPAGRVGAYRVRYARTPAGGAGFEEPREVSGRHGRRFHAVRFPSLALDGEGDPHLLWELHPDRGERSRGLGFTASADGGETFAEPTVVPGTDDPGFRMNGSLQGLLVRKLAVNGAGEVAVVNSSFEPGEASRVRLIRGRAAAER